jgi:3-oxoacyl-[acyl-carrier-protein] synthase-1
MVRLAIRTTGMVTAAGLDSLATFAALRAGISGINLAKYRDLESGEGIAGGRVPLWQWWEGVPKLIDLLAPAVQECLSAAPVKSLEIPLFVGLPSRDRPFRWQGLDESVLPSVQSKLGVRFHPASAVIPRDNVSGVAGLVQAGQLIDSGKARWCIVAGVDSFLQRDMVEAYMKNRRVLTKANSNGFIPGEAGTAMLVGAASSEPGVVGELHILGMSLSREKVPISSEEPFRAEGMIQAVRGALADAKLTINQVDYRITDLNGEHYKFKEAAYVTIGARRTSPGPFDLWHPIEFIGEIGAAAGPCALGWALHAGQKGYAPGSVALCHFSNDDGERAAVVVRFQLRGPKS